jgi:Na+/H+ antiporter NhaD/arsenite permease-like protein
MTLIIVIILLLGYILIATSSITRINKAASAMFAGTVGWVLYICWGTDYVMSQHPNEYIDWLAGANATSVAVKQYIAENIFLNYVGKGAEIVLFLLATMTIVEILNNNGCFDFLTQTMRTRNSRKLLWVITAITFIISANLDNITTTTMMLMIMHDIVPSRRQRMIYGSAIIIAANCGGALTVIGDTTGLLLWTNSMVTATDFSMTLMIPCLISWIFPTLWLSRMLPERIDSQWRTMPYRGDDTNLKIWQRLVMLIVGIGGLWFIPTFHNITKLSPFIGALCVLSVLWIVNEVMNSKMMDVDKMIQRRVPFVLQYGVVQLALFVMGIMLAIGVVQETGVIAWLSRWCSENIHNVWLMGVIAAAFSTVLDTFASALSFISLFPDFPLNAIYWKIIAYSTAMGGSTLMIGSVAGLALMKMEHIRVGWYLRNIGWVVILSWLMGMAVLYMMN